MSTSACSRCGDRAVQHTAVQYSLHVMLGTGLQWLSLCLGDVSLQRSDSMHSPIPIFLSWLRLAALGLGLAAGGAVLDVHQPAGWLPPLPLPFQAPARPGPRAAAGGGAQWGMAVSCWRHGFCGQEPGCLACVSVANEREGYDKSVNACCNSLPAHAAVHAAPGWRGAAQPNDSRGALQAAVCAHQLSWLIPRA